MNGLRSLVIIVVSPNIPIKLPVIRPRWCKGSVIVLCNRGIPKTSLYSMFHGQLYQVEEELGLTSFSYDLQQQLHAALITIEEL